MHFSWSLETKLNYWLPTYKKVIHGDILKIDDKINIPFFTSLNTFYVNNL
jgi:hypothetical protein